MSSRESLTMNIDGEFQRLLILALNKYKQEIDKKLIEQKSSFKTALFEIEKAQIQNALRRLNPIDKNLLPSLVSKKQVGTR